MPEAGRRVTVSAPGKLILMGEHAVVYGRPALVAAIDLRLSARFSDSPDPGVRLDLLDLGISAHLSWMEVRAYSSGARERWDDYSTHPGPESFREMRGEDPAHVVKAALGEAVEALGGDLDCGLELRVESDLPLGSGFGSSAATAVAVVAGFFSWQSAWRSAEVDPERIERLALQVERRQHGHPSGVDGATILRGGVLWARRLGIDGTGGLEIDPVPVRSPF